MSSRLPASFFGLLFALGCAASADQVPAGTGGSAGIFGGTGGESGTGGIGAIGGSAGSGAIGGTGAVGGTGGIGGTGGSGGSPSDVLVIDECGTNNPAGITSEQIVLLRAGGAPNSLQLEYPYDGTVFPRGTLAPQIVWNPPSVVAVHLRMRSSRFDYEGCLLATEAGLLDLPQHVWEAAGRQTRGPSDPFTIELTTLQSETLVIGPGRIELVIAQATLKGSIYYNSYSSPLAPNGGAVLRIPPGGRAEVFVGATQCTGCHSLSANGARLLTESEGGDPVPPPPFFGGFGGGAGGSGASVGPAVYAITPTTQPNPTPLRQPAPYAGFSALSPDGSVYIANAPGFLSTITASPPTALLIETDTGIEVLGSGVALGAIMPSFAPDGRSFVFNDTGDFSFTGGYHISVMDYDPALRRASNPRQLISGDAYYGWPFVLPDNGAVLYTRSIEDSSYGGGWGGVVPGEALVEIPESQRTELYLVDVASKTSVRLDAAMGHDPSYPEGTHLPNGAAELGRAYYPTVSPIAAGGYFWAFFDSVRSYGNSGPQRQLWGTAIAISPDGHYRSDPSHPAFYLPGQELGTGNHRAFTALDPCRADAASCESGVDCCSGFCTDGVCGTPVVPRCAQASEACVETSNCCNSLHRCIAGFCGELLE